MEQTDFLFVAEMKEAEELKLTQKQIADQVDSWRYCWGWEGPKVDGFCEIDTCCVELMPGEKERRFSDINHLPECNTIYAYMEQCRLIRQIDEENWEAVIEMGMVHGEPWHKDGIRVKLHILDIWPPTKQLRAERDE